MKKLSWIVCLMAAVYLVFPFSVFAAQPSNITKDIEVGFSEYNDSYSPDKEVLVDGVQYTLKDFHVSDTKKKTFTVIRDNLPNQNYSAPQECCNPLDETQSGVLLNTEFSEQKVPGKTKTFSERVKLYQVPLDTTVSQTRYSTYKDEETGATMNVTMQLVNSERSNPYWYNFGGIQGSVSDYDALFYTLKGSDVQIPKNDEYPVYEGYKDVILKSLGLGSEYRIVGSSWKGSAYENANGVLCRDLEYQTEKKVCDIESLYSTEVTLPETVTYTATSTYEDKANSSYIVTVEYEPVAKKMNTTTIILSVAIGILILAALISAILSVLSKKDKKKNV